MKMEVPLPVLANPVQRIHSVLLGLLNVLHVLLVGPALQVPHIVLAVVDSQQRQRKTQEVSLPLLL